MEPANKPEAADFQLLLSGLDSLYVGYYADPTRGQLDFDDLAYQKALRREDRRLADEPVLIGSKEFLLRPGGRYPYKYVLSCQDYEVCLTEHLRPNVLVQFSSKGLWFRGYKALHLEITEWLETLGWRAMRPATIVRLDWAFDYLMESPCFKLEHFVSRARKDNTWRSEKKLQTFQFGVGDTVVRVYDKVAEIKEQSDKSWFYQLWDETENVWRIEAQIRKARIKAADLKNLDELDDLLGDLLREVFSKHTTLRTPNRDPNRSRWPMAPLWADLLQAIDRIPQTGLIEAYDSKQEIEWRKLKASQSLYGHLKHFASLVAPETGRGPELTLEELCELLPDLLEEHYFPVEWKFELARRLKALEVAG